MSLVIDPVLSPFGLGAVSRLVASHVGCAARLSPLSRVLADDAQMCFLAFMGFCLSIYCMEMLASSHRAVKIDYAIHKLFYAWAGKCTVYANYCCFCFLRISFFFFNSLVMHFIFVVLEIKAVEIMLGQRSALTTSPVLIILKTTQHFLSFTVKGFS